MEIFTRSTLEPNSIIIGMTVLRFESAIVKLINDKVYTGSIVDPIPFSGVGLFITLVF